MAGTKQERVEAGLRRLIAGGEPGFTERLPSNRELAERFAVSTHVIFAAFRSLEREGLVERLPRKGVVVRREAATAAAELATMTCWICETLPDQVAFWQAVLDDFHTAHPGMRIEPRFVAPIHLAPAHGDPPRSGSTVVGYGDRQPFDLPCIPLPRLLGEARWQELQRSCRPELWRRADEGIDLPLWIQLSGLIARRRGGAPLPPRADWDWKDFADWAREHYGEGCFPVPPLGMLMESVGCYEHLAGGDDHPWWDEAPWLELLAVIDGLAQRRLFSFPTQEALRGPDTLHHDHSPMLLARSFHWPGYGLGRDPEVFAWPMPLHRDGILQTIPLFGCAIGTRPTPLQQAWFAFLLAPAFQRRIASAGFGLPALTPVQDALRAEPADALPPGMATVLTRSLERFGCTPSGRSAADDPESPVRRILRELLTPLLCGDLPRHEAERRLREQLAELRRHDAFEEARRRERARRALERWL